MSSSMLIALALATTAFPSPEGRALAYLAREVPRWSAENKCYSCHNNGDAARALYAAVRRAEPVPAEALADTTRWLGQPERWDRNGGNPGYSDKGLARIQFAAALVAAMEAGRISDPKPLARAADLVAQGQQKNGSWRVDAEGTVGSPTTYGTFLATYQAHRILQKADPGQYRAAIARANRYLQETPALTVLDAAAVLLAVDEEDEAAGRLRESYLALLRKAEAEKGGWGPYVNSPPEPFDTAVVLLALSRLSERAPVEPLVRRGRAYLVATQRPDGHWPETTRPAGSESYAQRLSTTGWATLALLATRGRQN